MQLAPVWSQNVYLSNIRIYYTFKIFTEGIYIRLVRVTKNTLFLFVV